MLNLDGLLLVLLGWLFAAGVLRVVVYSAVLTALRHHRASTAPGRDPRDG